MAKTILMFTKQTFQLYAVVNGGRGCYMSSAKNVRVVFMQVLHFVKTTLSALNSLVRCMLTVMVMVQEF